jgi:hypothetical protein
MWERWVIGVALLAGFLWVRSCVRALRGDEERSRKALYGVFLMLAPLLLVGKWIFDRLPFGAYINFWIELSSLALVFGLTGFLFLRKGPENGVRAFTRIGKMRNGIPK